MITMLRIAGIALVVSLMVSCADKEPAIVSPIPNTATLATTPTEQPNYEKTITSLPTVIATATVFNSYIGLKYLPLPSAIRTSTSWQAAIWNSSSPVSWGIDTVMDEKDIMLWFSKTVGHDAEGHAIFQVSDIAVLPSSARNKTVVVSECVFAGQPDYEIVALVKLDQESLDKRWLPNSNIITAWRANQATGKLEPISTEKIECNAEDFLSFPE
jgi:hypothetical protein